MILHGIYARARSVRIVEIALPVCTQIVVDKPRQIPSMPASFVLFIPHIGSHATTEDATANSHVAASNVPRMILVVPEDRRRRVDMNADLASAAAR